jgi:uncharacterized damage-inducible protein DinB
MPKSSKAIKVVIDFIKQAYNKNAWHGTTLRGSLRNVTIAEAKWRPSAKHHNIREIILHTAYWKYIIWRRLANLKGTSFEYSGNDWMKLPEKFDKKIWDKEKAILKKYHELLLSEIAKVPETKLERRPPGSKVTYKHLLLGIGSHDLYHAGQIQLLKRLKRGGIVK